MPPYDDPLIIAGQGTVGREIVEELAALGLAPDIVVVNASGGGLTAGIALAVKARAPEAKIYTAEPAGFDDHARSFRSGKRERNPALTGTICDALMAQSPGKLTFEINRVLVGEGVSASEEEVGRAVAFAFRELKLVVEPGGAVALAALLAGKVDVARQDRGGRALRRQCRSRAVRPPGGVRRRRCFARSREQRETLRFGESHDVGEQIHGDVGGAARRRCLRHQRRVIGRGCHSAGGLRRRQFVRRGHLGGNGRFDPCGYRELRRGLVACTGPGRRLCIAQAVELGCHQQM